MRVTKESLSQEGTQKQEHLEGSEANGTCKYLVKMSNNAEQAPSQINM